MDPTTDARTTNDANAMRRPICSGHVRNSRIVRFGCATQPAMSGLGVSRSVEQRKSSCSRGLQNVSHYWWSSPSQARSPSNVRCGTRLGARGGPRQGCRAAGKVQPARRICTTRQAGNIEVIENIGTASPARTGDPQIHKPDESE